MDRPLRRTIARLLAAALLLSMGACKGRTSAAGGLTRVTLQTDWYPQPEMGGFYQAQLGGLYRAAGLEVTILPGGPFVIGDQQVARGAVEFAMSSSDKVLEDVAHGLPLVAVGATMQQDPQAVMVHAESPVRGFSDLQGHTIAVKAGSTWFQYLLRRYKLGNVREIPATYSVANFLQDPAYIQQAFVTSEPFFARKGGAQVRTLPVSATGYQPYRVFVTSQGFLAKHPELVEAFVRASLAGWQQYLASPARVNAEIGKLNPAMSPEQMAFSVQTLKEQHFIDGDGSSQSHLGHFDPQRWSTLYRQLVELQVIDRPFDPATAYTTRFAP